MIHIEGLTKSFLDGEELHGVLRGVDLDIAAGDFVALVGRSGSGKSTLLHCIAGIETADAGRIEIDGVDLAGLDETGRTRLRRDRIGIVFQFFHLLPALTVRDNVELPAQLRGDDPAAIRRRSTALLEELGILDRAAQFPDRLSGGEQQRVAIARALVNEPALLLADEPTGNLDADTAGTILELFRQIHDRHGVTILMVTHSTTAAAVARHTAELVDGQVDWTEVEEPATAVEKAEPSVAPETASGQGIQIPQGSARKGPRPSARAAALFGGKGEDDDGQAHEGTEAEETPSEEGVEDAIDQALAESEEDRQGPA
jgi:putative ABC transport system ATP-binding protein